MIRDYDNTRDNTPRISFFPNQLYIDYFYFQNQCFLDMVSESVKQAMPGYLLTKKTFVLPSSSTAVATTTLIFPVRKSLIVSSSFFLSAPSWNLYLDILLQKRNSHLVRKTKHDSQCPKWLVIEFCNQNIRTWIPIRFLTIYQSAPWAVIIARMELYLSTVYFRQFKFDGSKHRYIILKFLKPNISHYQVEFQPYINYIFSLTTLKSNATVKIITFIRCLLGPDYVSSYCTYQLWFLLRYILITLLGFGILKPNRTRLLKTKWLNKYYGTLDSKKGSLARLRPSA